MADLVCVATRIRFGGLILRWYPDTMHRRPIASARLGGVRHHVYEHEIPIAVQAAAFEAWDLMQAGQWTAAAAKATHRRRGLFGLEPIVRGGLVCDGVPGRDLDQPVAVCGRVDVHGAHPVLGVGKGNAAASGSPGDSEVDRG